MIKPTLLYAEDDQESRENYAFILQKYFSDIYLAQNGKEALSLYYEKHPDILLLDISMPLLNGLDLVKTIRKDDPDTHIIMLSAHSDREKLLSAVNLKLEAYLLKPVDDTLLKETIIKLIRQIQTKESVYLREDLIWDKNHSSLIYKGEQLKITKKERLLLQLLTHNLGTYVSHDELIIHIWDDEIPDHSHDNKLIQLIYRFNKKIMQHFSSPTHLIENSYTLGYRLTCQ
jgi:DNA-binding response OmpR family regulator